MEGTDKQGIFNQLNDEFKADLDIFQEETGTQLILGLWTDNTPPSDMFILIGSQEQLLAKAEYLNRRFDLEGISDQLKEKARNGHALCESAVTLGENETILRAIIIVDVGRKPNYCIRRQLMVAFGLFGDLSEKDDSILAIRPTVVRPLTDLDRLFLKNLYQ